MLLRDLLCLIRVLSIVEVWDLLNEISKLSSADVSIIPTLLFYRLPNGWII